VAALDAQTIADMIANLDGRIVMSHACQESLRRAQRNTKGKEQRAYRRARLAEERLIEQLKLHRASLYSQLITAPRRRP